MNQLWFKIIYRITRYKKEQLLQSLFLYIIVSQTTF